jgi:hypothetical protein
VRIDAHGIKTACAQTLDKSTVAAADVEDARAPSNALKNERVEPAPPAIVSHGKDSPRAIGQLACPSVRE